MSWKIAAGYGFLLGIFHLVVFTRGILGILGGGEGSGHVRRRWVVLAGARFLMTTLLAVLGIRLWGLSPIGIGGGLVLAFFMWKLGAALWAATGRTSKENTA